MEGPRRRLQEGDYAHRRRRRPATAQGFLLALPSTPKSTEGIPEPPAERTTHER
jgi:hypothetical protein